MSNRMLFWLVYGVIFVSFFDMFSQLPIISPHAKTLGAGLTLTGVIVAAYSSANMAGNFLAGRAIRIFGRTRCIYGGLAMAAVALTGYALAATPTQFLSLRLGHGLAMSVVVPAAYAWLGQLASHHERGKDMAKSGIAIAFAALLGPAFGGIMKDRLGVAVVFLIVAGILVLTAVTVILALREGGETRERREAAVSIGNLLSRQGLQFAYLAAFCLMFAKGTLALALPLLAADLGFSGSVTGVLFSSFALAAIIVFATPSNRLSDRVGRGWPVRLGLLAVGISLVLLPVGSSLVYLAGVMFFYGLGFGFLFPAATAAVLDNARSDERGTAFGVFYGIFSLGVVLGPVVSSHGAVWLGWNPLPVGGLVALAGAAALLWLNPRQVLGEEEEGAPVKQTKPISERM